MREVDRVSDGKEEEQEIQIPELYIDIRDLAALTEKADIEKLESYINALKLFNKFKERLQEREELFAWQEWQLHFRNLYKKMINEAFEAFGVTVPKGMEVYFAGSLARAQATPFSDLDAFVLLQDEKDIENVKRVFQGLNNLCTRIFFTENQCYPDPIGMNPATLTGTPDTLFNLLEKGEEVDAPPTVRSIMSSLPIFGNYELGNQLKNKIRGSAKLNRHFTPHALYDKAIKDYPAPAENPETIDIKSHIIRPIDFIFMGLREEFGLYSNDGSHLTVPGTIKLINESKIDLPQEDANAISLILKTYYEVIGLRCEVHHKNEKEQDKIPYANAENKKQLKEMLDNVERLRQMAQRRSNALKNKIISSEEENKHPQPVSTWAKFKKAAARPATFLRNFLLGPVLGAIIGGGAGALIGTFIFPVIGTMALGIIGACGGGALGATGWSIYETVKKRKVEATAAGVLASMGVGAAIGAAIGTFIFPGIGTAIGAALGAGAGLTVSLGFSGLVHAFTGNPKAGAALMGTGALVGAGLGAVIGTFIFPGFGTAIGAGIGAAIGAAPGAIALLIKFGQLCVSGVRYLIEKVSSKSASTSESGNEKDKEPSLDNKKGFGGGSYGPGGPLGLLDDKQSVAPQIGQTGGNDILVDSKHTIIFSPAVEPTKVESTNDALQYQ
ncbi:hypothetical protein ACQUW5_04230 [Legionella sp. CNM-1927-20]|uniref:hypothetical protein n=1 Tax=Legionella sp. CNM-1927-20 TaxID=3422221 RepID=UPI00403A8F8D